MTSEKLLSATISAFRRQWWVVLIAVGVAAGVGFFSASSIQTIYTGQASIVIDPATVSKGIGIPEAEILLTNLQSVAFRERAAGPTGVTAAELRSNARIYTTGTPQDRLITEYSSPNEQVARDVAQVLATIAVEEARAMGAVELDKQRSVVAETSATIAELEKFEGTDSWQRSDVAYKVWSLKKDLASSQAALSLAEGAYAYDGTAVANVSTSAGSGRLARTAAAAFAGLIAGLGLALVRERQGMPVAGA